MVMDLKAEGWDGMDSKRMGVDSAGAPNQKMQQLGLDWKCAPPLGKQGVKRGLPPVDSEASE